MKLMSQRWDIQVHSFKIIENHLCKLNFKLKDESKKVKTWDISVCQPNIKFEKQQKKYDLHQFKLINRNKIQFVQRKNTRKQKIKLKKRLLCPISTI